MSNKILNIRTDRNTVAKGDLPLTGFTLIEILVVIAIILVLGTITTMGITNFKERVRVDSTKAMIERLKKSLQTYYERFRDYPPSEGQWEGSQNLYHFLGEKLEVTVDYDAAAGKGRTVLYDPAEIFKQSEVDGDKYILDAWKQRISYKKPGENHLPDGTDNRKTYDLSSLGSDGKEDKPDASEKDDINNWKLDE